MPLAVNFKLQNNVLFSIVAIATVFDDCTWFSHFRTIKLLPQIPWRWVLHLVQPASVLQTTKWSVPIFVLAAFCCKFLLSSISPPPQLHRETWIKGTEPSLMNWSSFNNLLWPVGKALCRYHQSNSFQLGLHINYWYHCGHSYNFCRSCLYGCLSANGRFEAYQILLWSMSLLASLICQRKNRYIGT